MAPREICVCIHELERPTVMIAFPYNGMSLDNRVVYGNICISFVLIVILTQETIVISLFIINSVSGLKLRAHFILNSMCCSYETA